MCDWQSPLDKSTPKGVSASSEALEQLRGKVLVVEHSLTGNEDILSVH